METASLLDLVNSNIICLSEPLELNNYHILSIKSLQKLKRKKGVLTGAVCEIVSELGAITSFLRRSEVARQPA